MKPGLLMFIQIHNFMIASVTGGMCPETLQECLNCKAAADCVPHRDIMTAVSKDDCTALLENAGNVIIMVEYQTSSGVCKAFNCQRREEAQGYNTIMISCRTDCPQYMIESRSQQSGSCFVRSRFATSSGHACLQFCLHQDGCMGVTHQVYPNDVNICTFHNCSSSVFDTMYNSTFTGITCTTIEGVIASSTYIPTPQVQLLTTQLKGNHTTVQDPVASTTTFDETDETSTQILSRTVTFSSSEWTPMRDSSDSHHLPPTTRHLDTTSNEGAVLMTTTSSWAVSSVVGSAVTVLASNC